MILTDADELRAALRLALEERDEARAEVERLRARGEELLDKGLVFFYGNERMADVARRQREACAKRVEMVSGFMFARTVRATPLVTDTKADGGSP